ncbi:ABC transporter permease [Azospirillum rugosum]|uniref:ABC transport system permease protein n=1 Tax=Azospirillum rugosum TaxID=416170 RepID=A0ABS4SL30_9PROT|nr:ABC transporter permease [Azospirillum rugosum]MBP2292120.1 putative ABC transport system permease protein [Azospirillum rugosum]MDQ0525744.1 putative ABC transport system permease protein [Azospirillum rugosum]
MSEIAFFGAVEIGLVYALVALGVYLSFRVLDFPDLTVDGSFPLGAAVCATLLVAGVNPWLASLAAALAGAVAGLVTATLNVRFKILHLLASILTMIALFSVNLRVMGRPNVALLMQDTVLTPFYGLGLPDHMVRPLVVAVVVVAVVLLLARFLGSEFGLAMRATGVNARMARAQGVETDFHIYTGMALSNGLCALAGALFAQTNGFADVTTGIGTIVVGLAAVIVGETVLPARTMLWALVGCVVGSILYRLAVQLALSADVIGLQASDLNLVTAVLVAVALILPRVRLKAGRKTEAAR